MNKFVRSQVLIISASLCLVTLISFWSLEKDRCFEIEMREGIKLKVNCYKLKP